MIIILFPDPEFKLAIEGVLLCIVAIFGLIGNTLAIVVLSRPSMRSPINLILIGNIQNSVQNSLYNPYETNKLNFTAKSPVVL